MRDLFTFWQYNNMSFSIQGHMDFMMKPFYSSNENLPRKMGGTEVKSKLKTMRYIWSIILLPENPLYTW